VHVFHQKEGLGKRVYQEKAHHALKADLVQRIPIRILLAEDNAVNQKLALRILAKMGYRADVAANGLEVLHALKEKKYHLIFMDVLMPEMDGLQATRQIVRQYPDEERPIIVAMTANAMRGDREKCLAAGMDDYISKPVQFHALQDIIKKWGPRALQKQQRLSRYAK